MHLSTRRRHWYDPLPTFDMLPELVPEFPAWRGFDHGSHILYMTKIDQTYYDLLYYRRASLTVIKWNYDRLLPYKPVLEPGVMRLEQRFTCFEHTFVYSANASDQPQLASVRDRILRHLPVFLMEEQL